MKSLFRAFDKRHVQYLLISGQACVLYGASQFTEDTDLWIQPGARNLQAFFRAMAQVKATVYKLTPPIRPTYLRKGHGFHFRIGDSYVDVMGKPPRVGEFRSALSRARRISTEWGNLVVAAPEDLVLLKRTNRPGDYEAISNLVRMRVSEDDKARTLYWALSNTFDIADLREYAIIAADILRRWPSRPAVRCLLPLRSGSTRISDLRIRAAAYELTLEMAHLQEKGRRYWKPVLAELKRLQRSNQLVPEGTPVASLI